MINKKKSYLALNIILIFFMIELLILPIKVQAASNISINLKAPIHEGVIEDKDWLLQECFLLILCLIFKDHIASATFIS
ncbi:hypothetical protein C3B64_19985 [Clostridium botulinum]|uniref:Secreted protein n=1 Tax=Clostridium botulinum TaxID=1491 RepID=A0AAU8Z1J7_CLOBO|nr:hypothetical protein C3B64_19985 [Clostridium botulinum]